MTGINRNNYDTTRPQAGQALLEYCFILLLAVLVVIAMIYTFGQTTNNTYCGINSTITSAFQH